MNNRQIVLEALKLQDGLTSGEIIEYAQQDNPDIDKQPIYNILNYMVGKGELNKEGKRYKLVQRRVYTNGNNSGIKEIRPLPETITKTQVLAGYQQGRKSKQVMVVSSPQYYDDIVRIELIHAGGAFIVPLFGALTICTGPDIPKLAPEQESYRGVRSIRLTFRNGKVENLSTSEVGHVTIAPTQS